MKSILAVILSLITVSALALGKSSKSAHRQKKKQIRVSAEMAPLVNQHLHSNNLLDTSDQSGKALSPPSNTLLSNAASVQADGTVIENGLQTRIAQSIGIIQGETVNSLNERSAFPLRVSSLGQSCSCASGAMSNPDNVLCPPCVLGKTMRQMHQLASEYAQEDAANQSGLEQESLLEKRLFQAAKHYASLAAANEDKARLAALEMQKFSSQAQIARDSMTRAESEAKQLAVSLVNTLVIHPPHDSQGIPGMQIQRTGATTKSIIQKTPYYNLHVGQTSQTGFLDGTQQQLALDTASPALLLQ